MSKHAVVLFNLGGPDSPEAVRPFLFNLFNDPAILTFAQPFRWLLAQIISRARNEKAQGIYAKIGGRSPLLELTREQASALETKLNASGPDEYRVFVAMRYWHPFANETAAMVAAFAPDDIVLLPLYPQFSSTTTQSSFDDWTAAADRARIAVPTYLVRSYCDQEDFIAAQAELLTVERAKAGPAPIRVLFSAHGLPMKVIEAGDPYQREIETSAAAIAVAAGLAREDWVVCYQSKVGPMKWLAPSIDAELERAQRDRLGVVVLPIAFVSEHSETLVELDMDYRDRAAALGVTPYLRVPALGTHPTFIAGLARLIATALERRSAS